MNVLIFGVIKWSRIWFFSGLVHVLWLRKLCRDMIQSVNLSFFLAFLNIFTTANILVQCAPTKAIEKWKLCPVHSTFLKLKKIVFADLFNQNWSRGGLNRNEGLLQVCSMSIKHQLLTRKFHFWTRLALKTHLSLIETTVRVRVCPISVRHQGFSFFGPSSSKTQVAF